MKKGFIFSMIMGVFVGLFLGVVGFALFQGLYKSKNQEGLKAELAKITEEAKIAQKGEEKNGPQETLETEALAVLYAETENRQGRNYWQKIFLKKSENTDAREIILPENAFRFEMPVLSHNEIFFYTSDSDFENPKNDHLFLFRADLNSKNPKEVLPYTRGVSPKGFLPSPDYKKIGYFLNSRLDNGSEIWVYDTEKGLNFVAIELLEKQMNENIVSWSTNSDRFYFLKKMNPYLYILHYADINDDPIIQTQEFQRVHWEDVNWKQFVWGEGISFFNLSPDKKYIAYLSPLKKEIKLINTKSGVFTNLISALKIKEILWHPDSESLIYTKEGEGGIFQINLSLQREEKIIGSKDTEIENLEITPNGKFLGFNIVREDVSEVVLVNLKNGEKTVIAREEEPLKSFQLISFSYLSKEKPPQKEIIAENQARRIEESGLEEREIKEIIGYVAANIDAIAPDKRTSGWEIKRFWFVDSRNLYVDFESGSDKRRVLLSFDTLTDEEAGYRIKAYFEAVGDKWVLRKGQAQGEEESLILYVFNKEKNKWEKE